MADMYVHFFCMLGLGIIIPEISNGQQNAAIEFCSSQSFRRSVSSRLGERLVLDASDSAIVSRQFLPTIPNGVTSCVCTVKYGGLEDSEISDQLTSDARVVNTYLPTLFVRHRADGTNNCGKSIEVTRFGVLVKFRCSSSDLQLQDIPVEDNVTLILEVETPKPADTVYEVVFEPDGVTAVFYVTCWPPYFPTDTTPYTTPLYPTTVTTMSDSGDTGNDSTGVQIGVAVAVTVPVIVIIVGVICMRKRKLQKDNKAKENPTKDIIQKKDDPRANQYNKLEPGTNSESHIYDYIRPEDVRRGESFISRNSTSGPRVNNSSIPTNVTLNGNTRPATRISYINDNSNRTRTSERSGVELNAPRNQNQLHYTGGYLHPVQGTPEYLEVLPS